MINQHGNSGELKLVNLTPFGIGGRRLCFIHPYDPDRCVKVLRQDDQRTVRLNKRRIVPARFRRIYDNNQHEKDILEELNRRIGPAMTQHLPLCYGMVPTDLGPGLVLDLVRDSDSKISLSIREWITIGGEIQDLKPAFSQLGEFLLEHVVLTRKLLDHNMVVKQDSDGSYRLYIIDGLGDPAWLPFARCFRSLGHAKVRKRLAEAWPRFEKFAASGGVTDEMMKNSTWGQGILKHRE